MKKYILFTFIIIGMVFSIGLVSHIILSDKDQINEFADDRNSGKPEINPTAQPATQVKRSVVYKTEYNEIDETDRVQSDLDEEHQEDILDNFVQDGNESEVINPWYDDGKPGTSRAELESMHEYQLAMIEKEMNDPDAIVIEATDDHPAVTRAELEALHAEQMQQIQEELNNPDTIVY